MIKLTEDQVRDLAKIKLGFDKVEKNIKQGTGQITTFNQLGFKGINDKPDGWYLPSDMKSVAIILETKSESHDLDNKKWIDELIKNCNIVLSKYKKVIGILYNGNDIKVFKNNVDISDTVSKELESKKYYINLFETMGLNKERIYTLTAKINNCLHSEFGIKNLYHRMIFTACALVATRYGAILTKGMDYSLFHQSILNTLSKSLEEAKKQNQKLDLLCEVYSGIKMNSTENQEAIDNFIDWVTEISDCINSNAWNGEDVMGIFFNEFNRYKKKSENGQVFTPDHITSFMYRLIGTSKDDYILDATCGSGAFLVKSMSNMIKEAGGVDTAKAKKIKSEQLFGIEFDREIFALACANMLIHKDGKTNLQQMDTRTSTACEWMKSKPITKVLMNPPYENKYGCIQIVENVLNSVRKGTECAFILPDKKLEKVSQKAVKRILRKNRLEKIIKLPENLFFGVGVTTSIFVFKAGYAQENNAIFGCYIEEDGLETVKNKGRHDIKNKWQQIEDYWIESIKKSSDLKYKTNQWINPNEHLSYQMPEKEFSICEEDFKKTALEYILFKKGINNKALEEKLTQKVLYGSNIKKEEESIKIILDSIGDKNE